MGNTKVVDLGYLDGTYMTLTNGNVRTVNLSTQQAYMSDIKQRLITAGLNDGVNWSLSRIVFSQGTVNAGYGAGMYIFVIKHLVAGVASGDEWMLALPPAGTTQLSNQIYNWGINVTELNTYFYGLAAYGTTTSGTVWLDYNPNGTTSTWDIGAGADFDAVAVSPKTNLPGFMPAGVKPKGMYNSALTITEENRLALVFNHTAKVIGVVVSDLNSVGSYQFSGRIITPKRVADTHNYGAIRGASTNATLATSSIIETVNDSGTPIQCTPQNHLLFLAGNQPYFDGSVYRYHRDAAIVYNASYIKGELKPDLFPIQGPQQRHYLRMYESEHGRALKVNDTMCIPWADDVPPPFAGWPLNPQVPTIIAP